MPVILSNIDSYDPNSKHQTSVSTSYGVAGMPMRVFLKTTYLTLLTEPDPDGWAEVGDWCEEDEVGDSIDMSPEEAEKLAAALLEHAAKARKHNEENS